jgi:hypothetical protein
LGDGTYQPRGIAREVRVTWQTNPYAARGAALYAGINSCAPFSLTGAWHVGVRRVLTYKPARYDPTLLEAGIVPGNRQRRRHVMGQHYACVLRRDAHGLVLGLSGWW